MLGLLFEYIWSKNATYLKSSRDSIVSVLYRFRRSTIIRASTKPKLAFTKMHKREAAAAIDWITASSCNSAASLDACFNYLIK